jgi:uncharacterized protein
VGVAVSAIPMMQSVSMSLSVLDKQQCISLVTFKRDGTGVPTPIWFAPTDRAGVYVAYTDLVAGKVKRIRATGRVTAQPCSMSGKVADGAPKFEGTARIIEGADATDAERRLAGKYGWKKKLFETMQSIGLKIKRKPKPEAAYLEITLA